MITYKAITSTGELINSVLSPFQFPAGEAHLKVGPGNRGLEPTEVAIIQPSPETLNTDLFHLAMWNDYLTTFIANGGEVRRRVIMPYLPAARADRGTPFGLGIYFSFLCDAAAGCELTSFDIHSDVGITFLTKNKCFPENHMTSDELLSKKFGMGEYDAIIAPDKGAVDRAQAVADALGIPLFKAEKNRDFETGKLTGYSIKTFDREDRSKPRIHDGNRVLVVDDICDGGGTFVLLAKAIRETGLDIRLDLYVSHGIFSGNAVSTLPQYYDHIFTTNSYSPLRSFGEYEEFFHRFDVIRPMLDRG